MVVRFLRRLSLIIITSFLLTALLPAPIRAAGGEVSGRFDQMSDSSASATSTHLLGFTINQTGTPLGSIEFQFCSNNPIPNQPCDTPMGLDVSHAVLSNQTGNTGFAIIPSTNANTLILTHNPPIATPYGVPNTYQFDNIINPSSAGTYYIRIYIYQSIDASGTDTEDGGVAIAINNALSVAAGVPPYLKFCTGLTITNYDCSTASGYSIDFGNLSSSRTSDGSSQFTVATNATSGYNVTVAGTTMTSGNNVINALNTPTPAATGTNQFGINLMANTSPKIGADPSGSGTGLVQSFYSSANRFAYRDGDNLVTSTAPSDYQTFTVSYITDISASDPPGVYTTTLTLICLANF